MPTIHETMNKNLIPSVHNMTSSNGNTVPNQFIVKTERGTFFKSYDTIIAWEKPDGKIVLDARKWDYSKTTGKYRNQFLSETKMETERKIKSGEYFLDNLNE